MICHPSRVVSFNEQVIEVDHVFEVGAQALLSFQLLLGGSVLALTRTDLQLAHILLLLENEDALEIVEHIVHLGICLHDVALLWSKQGLSTRKDLLQLGVQFLFIVSLLLLLDA